MAQTKLVGGGAVDGDHLHDLNGHLNQVGYSTEPVLNYERSRIKASKWRIKEWDYYYINDDQFGVALTVGDMGYSGLLSASVVSFAGEGKSRTNSVMTPLPLGNFRMPASSTEGTTYFENRRVIFEFGVEKGKRHIHVRFAQFADGEDLVFNAVLDDEPRDSMVIATPWPEDPLAFYYNRKIVGMRATGSVKLGSLVHGFEPGRSFGLLDWGRGVWTRDNTWYWGFAQGWQDGAGDIISGTHTVGLNLGYGFGDTSAASENMLFIDGEATKLETVVFDIPRALDANENAAVGERFRLMEPWRITDSAGIIDLTFVPQHDRNDYINYGVIVSDQHQVFGTYNGTVQYEGRPFTIAGLRGAAEVVRNKY